GHDTVIPPVRLGGPREKKERDSEILLSIAKPARRPNDKCNKKAAAHSVASVFGVDWFYEAVSCAPNPSAEGERLQKVLAKAGVASRRHAEVLIDAGRVEVNGKVIKRQGVRVNPNVDVIRVDGVRVNVNEDHEYFILN